MKRLDWGLMFLSAVAGVFLWCHLSLPRYQAIDLSISQSKAIGITSDFLKRQRHVDPSQYKIAVTFIVDEAADRYLQRTLGIRAYQQLIKKLHYDLFFWVVRYFKEKQKEEYKIAVSSATGQIIGFNHIIPDTAARPSIDKEVARQQAFNFILKTYGFTPDNLNMHAENINKLDNRDDYAFSWQHKGVLVPWKKGGEDGEAKLLTSVTVSGNEILTFNKFQFEIPDAFDRYVDNLKQTGENLTLVFRLIYLALITLSIVVVVNRKNQVVNRSVKPFYVGVGIAMFALMFLDVINSFQDIIYSYPTTQSWTDYIVGQMIQDLIGPFFVTVAFVLPALAGESLRYEVNRGQKQQGLLSTLFSSFFSTAMAGQLLAAYLAAAIVLGAQALIFSIGFKYWGVWDELDWLTQASTSVLPAFSALVVGFHASFSEEAMFRLFAINFLRKYGVPVSLAVFLSAAMWGFGHTGYAIFPMWFRGVEVTGIGILMGIFYLRFGLACVIAAHYLVDAFLSSLPFLLNPQGHFNFYSSLAVISVPLVLAVIALVFNKNAAERPLRVRFNAQQQFNFSLLQELCRNKTVAQMEALRGDLERHGWDAALIQRVFEEKA